MAKIFCFLGIYLVYPLEFVSSFSLAELKSFDCTTVITATCSDDDDTVQTYLLPDIDCSEVVAYLHSDGYDCGEDLGLYFSISNLTGVSAKDICCDSCSATEGQFVFLSAFVICGLLLLPFNLLVPSFVVI